MDKIFFSPQSTQYPRMTKQKHVFEKCLQKIKTKIPYLCKYSDPFLWDSKLSSGASCFHWSSLRSFYNLIGVHLWYIKLIGHDLETAVYIRFHSWQCMSEQTPSHEVEGLVRRAPRQDCVEAQIWGMVTKHFCSIEGTEEHSGPHHYKWKKFATTKTLPRAGNPAKLSNWGRRALVREVTKNPMVTLTEP